MVVAPTSEQPKLFTYPVIRSGTGESLLSNFDSGRYIPIRESQDGRVSVPTDTLFLDGHRSTPGLPFDVIVETDSYTLGTDREYRDLNPKLKHERRLYSFIVSTRYSIVSLTVVQTPTGQYLLHSLKPVPRIDGKRRKK